MLPPAVEIVGDVAQKGVSRDGDDGFVSMSRGDLPQRAMLVFDTVAPNLVDFWHGVLAQKRLSQAELPKGPVESSLAVRVELFDYGSRIGAPGFWKIEHDEPMGDEQKVASFRDESPWRSPRQEPRRCHLSGVVCDLPRFSAIQRGRRSKAEGRRPKFKGDV